LTRLGATSKLNKTMNFRNKEGQALLLVMLAMATLATMVLSVVSRSVSEVNVTTREDESLRAFSAAEAGVEEALIHGSQGDIVSSETPIRIEDSLDVPVSGGTNAVVSTYKADIGKYPEDLTKFNYPFELVSGQAGSVWFRTRDSDTILPCSKDNCFSGSSCKYFL
jgi:type II secretory pathway pseudopilin PulG